MTAIETVVDDIQGFSKSENTLIVSRETVEEYVEEAADELLIDIVDEVIKQLATHSIEVP